VVDAFFDFYENRGGFKPSPAEQATLLDL
jgi:hypothetical protein